MKRYEKQIIMTDIGYTGQQKLLSATILIVGCGGIGNVVAPLLAASGIGKLLLCDPDKIELSNLNRQFIYKNSDIGAKKAKKAALFIKELNPEIKVQAVDSAINYGNFEILTSDVDLIIDCTDRLFVKFFLNDIAFEIKKPLIHSSAIGFTGEILTIPSGGRPCLKCFFEIEIPKKSEDINCANAGVLGSTCSIIGSLVVNEAIKYLLNIGGNLIGKLHRIDLKTNNFTLYHFTENPDCSVCSR